MFIAIIVDIIFAAKDDVDPLSNDGLSSTTSEPTIWLFSKDVIISYNSLDVIPTASGFPTPGANAGSITSRSILTYNLSKLDMASFSNLVALPNLISLSEIELILCLVKNSNSSFTNDRAPT